MEQTPGGKSPLREDHLVVDTDVHIQLADLAGGGEEGGRHLLAEYMDEPYSSYLRAPDASYPFSGWSKTLGGTKPMTIDEVATPDDVRREVCAGFGVDYPILNPFARPDQVRRTPRALAEMRAANDILIHEYLDDNDDFFGLATVAMREPDKAAEEIDRIGDVDGIVGVFIEAGAEFQRPLGDPSHDVVYQAMVRNDLTPAIHIGRIHHSGAGILNKLESYYSVHALGPIWSGMLSLTSLIAQATPEKFPELNFAVLECGISWIPMMLSRLNREHGQFRKDVPMLKRSPESYIRDSFYFSTQPIGEFNSSKHMSKIIDIVGIDTIMFATDYPHHDFDSPTAIERFLSDRSPEERAKVFSGNAIEAFGLDV